MINKLKTYLGSLEAVIVFGSWSRSGGGEWSDIDVLIVSDDAEKIEVLDRFLLASTLCTSKCDVFIYSYREVESMVKKGNPLILSALKEGIKVIVSDRLEKLAQEVSKACRRVGRMWICKEGSLNS